MRNMSLEQFAAHITDVRRTYRGQAMREALDVAARVVKSEAKREIGHYQDGIAGLAGWAALAESTRDDRVRQGFGEDEPLLRTAALRRSIQHDVSAREQAAVVGSDLPEAEYQELGTQHIPPRSFLGGAAARKGEHVAHVLGERFVQHLVGKEVFQGSIQIPTDGDGEE